MNIQLRAKQILSKHYEKLFLKIQLASWFFVYFFKRFRSFNTINIESVGQRAAKLLAFKVGGVKKKPAT